MAEIGKSKNVYPERRYAVVPPGLTNLELQDRLHEPASTRVGSPVEFRVEDATVM
jgi:hypothetical protein